MYWQYCLEEWWRCECVSTTCIPSWNSRVSLQLVVQFEWNWRVDMVLTNGRLRRATLAFLPVSLDKIRSCPSYSMSGKPRRNYFIWRNLKTDELKTRFDISRNRFKDGSFFQLLHRGSSSVRQNLPFQRAQKRNAETKVIAATTHWERVLVYENSSWPHDQSRCALINRRMKRKTRHRISWNAHEPAHRASNGC